MNIEESVIDKLKVLPLEKQKEVLDSIELVHQESQPRQPRRNLKGLWKDLNIQITEKDIIEARRELGAIFQRKIFDEFAYCRYSCIRLVSSGFR
jgi:hypothetical protein